MADGTQATGTEETGAAAPTETATAAAGARRQMAVRLIPVNNSDHPVVANYSNIDVMPGMVFVDFGFIEPGALAALPRVARQGGKLPETIGGKLAVRVALGFDALANLHQQLGGVLSGLESAVRARQQQQSGKKQE